MPLACTPVTPRRHPPPGGGFTLVELLVTLMVMVIALVVAVPSFADMLLGNKLSSYSSSFMASVNLARSEAIKRNGMVELCRSADGASCASSGGWQQGWIVHSGSTLIHHQQALASGFQLTGSAYSIQFMGLGVGSTPAELVLCRALPSAGSQERTISLSATGRVTITKTSTGSCS